MSLLSPWGLWWLLSVPLLFVFYLFRPEPRRRLSSTHFLWKQSVPESQGGVYAKRLRSNPLLWLQLLVLILLTLYLARPATSWSTVVPESHKVVLVIDRSASMAAGGAFEQAVEKAEQAIDGLFGFANLGSQPEVMLLAVDREPQIIVPFTSDSQQLSRGLAGLAPNEVADNLESLRPFFASLISDQKATIWLFSDHLPSQLEIEGLQFTACGDEIPSNSGLQAFSVEISQDTGSPKPFVYARIQNFSTTAEQRLLKVEKLRLENPDQVEAVVMETSVLLAAGGGRTINQSFPTARLSGSQPSLFRAKLLPVPGSPEANGDGYSVDDTAYTIAPPFGQDRVRVAVTPELQANFLVRALMATKGVEMLDWDRLRQTSDAPPLDLLVCPPTMKLPPTPKVRTKFEVSQSVPDESTPVEVLQASPDQPLVQDSGAEWSRLRVQRDTKWSVAAGETVLLSTATGPALTLKGVGEGQPTLCWRFPLAYSSLPLSPALPVLVGRFLNSYSLPAALALSGSSTTTTALSRPAGPTWQGDLQIDPILAGPLAGGAALKSGDRQLPRLAYGGIYQAQNVASRNASLLAVNPFSTSESALPRTNQDRSFSQKDSTTGPATGLQKRQYRESTRPLAALALLLLLIESAVFLHRGRP